MKKFTFAKKSKLMNQEALKTLCLESCEIIKEVGNFIRAELGKVKANAIEVKALNSLVSYVDKEAETQLVKGLG
ncbi:MAG: myo-inositol-1(or 4)-monophosphatase, partial [Saprospiraceae bacterium]